MGIEMAAVKKSLAVVGLVSLACLVGVIVHSLVVPSVPCPYCGSRSEVRRTFAPEGFEPARFYECPKCGGSFGE